MPNQLVPRNNALGNLEPALAAIALQRIISGQGSQEDYAIVMRQGADTLAHFRRMYPGSFLEAAVDDVGRIATRTQEMISSGIDRFTTPDQRYIHTFGQSPDLEHGQLTHTGRAAVQRRINIFGEDENQPDTQMTETRTRPATQDNNPRSTQLIKMEEPTLLKAGLGPTGPMTSSSTTLSRGVTPVDKIPPSYPWHDTTQAILPMQFTLSSNALASGAEGTNTFMIRMNTPKTPLADNPAYVAQVADAVPVIGISKYMAGQYTCTNTGASFQTYYHRGRNQLSPVVVLATSEPGGNTYYNLMYGAYSVTKVDWKITTNMLFDSLTATAHTIATIIPTATQTNHDPTLKTRQYISYFSTGDSVTNVAYPRASKTYEIDNFIGMEDKCTIHQNETVVKTGTWFPGKVKHSVINDGDVNVWSVTGAAPDTGHLEFLYLQHKLANEGETSYNNGALVCCNFKVELKYHIQYKELRAPAMWENVSSAGHVMTIAGTSQMLQT